MKIDVTAVLKQLNGDPIMVDQEHETAELPTGAKHFVLLNGVPKLTAGKPLTVERAIVEAVMSDLEEDKRASAAQKVERGRLADRICGASLPVDISDTEASLILARVAQVWQGVLITYRIDTIITAAKTVAAEAVATAKAAIKAV